MPGEVSIDALVLAGGRATRMGGIAKHAILVDGETILARQARVLRAAVDEILVSSPVAIDGFRTVRDAPDHAGIGPLAGIAAGLAATSAHWLFVVAGDMPYLSGPLIAHMLELAATAGGREVVDASVHAIGVRRNELPEPLFCALRVSLARDVVRAMIAARDYKASKLLDALCARYVADAVLRDCDPDRLALHNINAPHDLATG